MLDGKSGFGGAAANRPLDPAVVQFSRRTAAAADEKLADMVAVRMHASDEGIEASDAVDQTVRDQKVQCAVNRGRCHATALTPEALENRIGADRLVAAPDQLQHAPSPFGEPRAAPRAKPLSRGERGRRAISVVVVPRLKGAATAWARSLCCKAHV